MLILLILSFSTFDFALIPYSSIQTLGKDVLFFNDFKSLKVLYRPIIEEDSIPKVNIAGGFTDYFMDMNTTYFTFSYKKLNFGVFSFNAGKVEVTDSNGFKTGEVFSPTHIGFAFSLPFVPFSDLWNMKKGISIKTLYVKLKEFSSFSFAFDFSFLKEFFYKEIKIRTSLDFKNIGFSTNKKASIPPYEISISISPDFGKLKPAIGISYEEDLFSYRLQAIHETNRFLKFLLGFDSRRKEIVESEGLHRILTGFGAGVILSFKRISICYSYIPSGVFQDLNKLDISLSF